METQASQPGEPRRVWKQGPMAAISDTHRAGKSLQQNQEARVRLCSRMGSTPCSLSLTGPGWPSASATGVHVQQPLVTRPLVHWSELGLWAGRADSSLRGREIYFSCVSPPHSLKAKTWENKLGHAASWERDSDLSRWVFRTEGL